MVPRKIKRRDKTSVRLGVVEISRSAVCLLLLSCEGSLCGAPVVEEEGNPVGKVKTQRALECSSASYQRKSFGLSPYCTVTRELHSRDEPTIVVSGGSFVKK